MELFLLPCVATGVSLLAVWCLIGATASGAAVDICSDAPAWAQRAECVADGGVVDVSRARSVSGFARDMCLCPIRHKHVSRANPWVGCWTHCQPRPSAPGCPGATPTPGGAHGPGVLRPGAMD